MSFRSKRIKKESTIEAESSPPKLIVEDPELQWFLDDPFFIQAYLENEAGRIRLRSLMKPYDKLYSRYFPHDADWEIINRSSFQIPFQHKKEILGPLIMNLGERCQEWSAGIKQCQDTADSACYSVLYGGRGEGKSRAFLELPSCGISIMYVNCRDVNSVGYPKRTSAFASFFEREGLTPLQALALLVTYVTEEYQWFKDQGKSSTVGDLTEMWYRRMTVNESLQEDIVRRAESMTQDKAVDQMPIWVKCFNDVASCLLQMKDNLDDRFPPSNTSVLQEKARVSGPRQVFIFDHMSIQARNNWPAISEALLNVPRGLRMIGLMVPTVLGRTDKFKEPIPPVSPTYFKGVYKWDQVSDSPGGFCGPFRGAAGLYSKLCCDESPAMVFDFLKRLVMKGSMDGQRLTQYGDARVDFCVGSLFGTGGCTASYSDLRDVCGRTISHGRGDRFILKFPICATSALVASRIVAERESHYYSLLTLWQYTVSRFDKEFWSQSIVVAMLVMSHEQVRVRNLGFETWEGYREAVNQIIANVPWVSLSDLFLQICEGSQTPRELFNPLTNYNSRIVCFGLQEKQRMNFEDVIESANGGFGFFSQSKTRLYDIVFGVKTCDSVRAVFIKADWVTKNKRKEQIERTFTDIGNFADSISPPGAEHIAILVEFGPAARQRVAALHHTLNTQIAYHIHRPDFTSAFHPFLRELVQSVFWLEKEE